MSTYVLLDRQIDRWSACPLRPMDSVARREVVLSGEGVRKTSRFNVDATNV